MLRNAPVMLNSAPRNVAWQPQTANNFPKQPAVMAGIWMGASTFDPHVERKGEGRMSCIWARTSLDWLLSSLAASGAWLLKKKKNPTDLLLFQHVKQDKNIFPQSSQLFIFPIALPLFTKLEIICHPVKSSDKFQNRTTWTIYIKKTSKTPYALTTLSVLAPNLLIHDGVKNKSIKKWIN